MSRRALRGLHREMARHDREREALVRAPNADIPVTRLSIADLDRLGARLLPTRVMGIDWGTQPDRTVVYVVAPDGTRAPVAVCPVCLGSGEVVRPISDARVDRAMCLECGGRGYYEEVV